MNEPKAKEPAVLQQGGAPHKARPRASADAMQRSEHESGVESGGRDGPEPTRFGDWEKNGRCIDF